MAVGATKGENVSAFVSLIFRTEASGGAWHTFYSVRNTSCRPPIFLVTLDVLQSHGQIGQVVGHSLIGQTDVLSNRVYPG